jgi:hypothetical protein
MASRDTAEKVTTVREIEWSALATEWTRLAEEWDRCAASWSAKASKWRGSDARTGHAVEQAKWASAQTRQVAEWVRGLAREMLTLTSSS